MLQNKSYVYLDERETYVKMPLSEVIGRCLASYINKPQAFESLK